MFKGGYVYGGNEYSGWAIMDFLYPLNTRKYKMMKEFRVMCSQSASSLGV
jgi:hypothetical protein